MALSDVESEKVNKAIKEVEQVPLECMNPECNNIVGWIPVDASADQKAELCATCKAVPKHPTVRAKHRTQLQQLRMQGEAGEEMLPCRRCGASPCECLRCKHCRYENSPVYFGRDPTNPPTPQQADRCQNCGYRDKDSPHLLPGDYRTTIMRVHEPDHSQRAPEDNPQM